MKCDLYSLPAALDVVQTQVWNKLQWFDAAHSDYERMDICQCKHPSSPRGRPSLISANTSGIPQNTHCTAVLVGAALRPPGGVRRGEDCISLVETHRLVAEAYCKYIVRANDRPPSPRWSTGGEAYDTSSPRRMRGQPGECLTGRIGHLRAQSMVEGQNRDVSP